MMKRFLVVLMALMMACAMFAVPGVAADEPPIILGGVEMFPNDYLATGASETSATKPTGGYAYLFYDSNDSLVLELNRYKCSSTDLASILDVKKPLTINVTGDSKLTSNDDGISLHTTLLNISGSAKLTIKAKAGIWGYSDGNQLSYRSSLTISSGALEIIADTPIKIQGALDINGGTLDIHCPNIKYARAYTSINCLLPMPSDAAINAEYDIPNADGYRYCTLVNTDGKKDSKLVRGYYHVHLPATDEVPGADEIPDTAALPATGDSSSVMLWAVLAAASVLVLVIMRRKQTAC